mgnify:CR=1 FL=1
MELVAGRDLNHILEVSNSELCRQGLEVQLQHLLVVRNISINTERTVQKYESIHLADFVTQLK